VIEPYEETIDGIAYRITFDVEDFEGVQTYPALVWKQDAGDWRFLFLDDGDVTRETSIAACIQRILHDAHA